MYAQAMLEETAAYLKTKAEQSIGPLRSCKYRRSSGNRVPLQAKQNSFFSEALPLNLRSFTPVDRAIRDRVKVVYAAVQNRLLQGEQSGPQLRRKSPSLSLRTNIFRGAKRISLFSND